LGVGLASYVHGENVVAAMLSGKKRGQEAPMQRRHILRVLTAFAFGTFIVAPMAARSDEPSSSSTMGRMNRWAADQETLLDAKIAGFKAGLKLTPDQERLWAPFETAVRDADKMHIDQMKSMMDRMQKMRSAMQQQ
jgi:hypothetical protein